MSGFFAVGLWNIICRNASDWMLEDSRLYSAQSAHYIQRKEGRFVGYLFLGAV